MPTPRSVWVRGVGLLASLIGGVTLAAGQVQDPRTQRPAADLLAAVPRIASVATDTSGSELTIRWIVGAGPSGTPAGGASPPLDQFDLVRRRAIEWTAVRERDPQLSLDQIVVVARDGDGRELGWQQIKDPRIIRAESPGPDGTLSGQILQRALTEIVVTLPAGMSATELRIYEPNWTGTEFVLRALGSVAVPR